MSTTYSVKDGDTLESIAKKVYGHDAGGIAQANPGVYQLSAGQTLIIPSVYSDNGGVVQNDNTDDVVLSIDNERFRFWTSVVIDRSIDAFSVASFEAPFEIDNKKFRSLFRPFSFRDIEIHIGGELIFKGTLMNITPLLDDSARVSVSCYSRCGAINDCTAPASAFPYELNGQGLKQVCEKLLKPFGIGVEVAETEAIKNGVSFFEEVSQPFERTALKTDQVIISYVADLAKQKNLLVGDTPNGNLSLRKPVNKGSPVAILQEGSAPLVSVKPAFNSQECYSHVTGIEPVGVGQSGGQYTVRNDRISALRPLNFISADTEGGNLKASVEAKMGRVLGNMATYTVLVSTLRDPSGNLWKSNTTLLLKAPSAMIYNSYEFIIKSVSLIKNESETAELTLVIPESFTAQLPEAMPWDE